MGGGSSSDEKTNQINKQAFEQLQKQVLNPKDQQNPQQKSKSKLNSPKNSPKISPKNSPRNNNSLVQEPLQQSYFKNNKTNSPRQSRNPSGLKGNQKQPNNQDIVNQKDMRKPSQQDKEILDNIELSKKGQYKVGVLLLKITPGNKIGKQMKLQQTESTYEATLNWNFDQRTKKWNFTLQKPESTELSFTVNQRGEVIKGQQDKWELFNPSFSDLPRTQTRFYKEQLVTESLERNNYWLPSFDQLKKKKKSLSNQWNQEHTERVAEFPPVKNYSQTNNNSKSITESKAYHEIRKFFQKDTDDWHLTLDIVENDNKFHAFLTWKVRPQDQNLHELLQKEKRILQLKKKIYLHKVNLLTIQK